MDHRAITDEPPVKFLLREDYDDLPLEDRRFFWVNVSAYAQRELILLAEYGHEN